MALGRFVENAKSLAWKDKNLSMKTKRLGLVKKDWKESNRASKFLREFDTQYLADTIQINQSASSDKEKNTFQQ